MKKGKRTFSKEEKLHILTEAKRKGIAATLEKYTIDSDTFNKWKLNFTLKDKQVLFEKMKKQKSDEIKDLEYENNRLNRLIVEKEFSLKILKMLEKNK